MCTYACVGGCVYTCVCVCMRVTGCGRICFSLSVHSCVLGGFFVVQLLAFHHHYHHHHHHHINQHSQTGSTFHFPLHLCTPPVSPAPYKLSSHTPFYSSVTSHHFLFHSSSQSGLHIPLIFPPSRPSPQYFLSIPSFLHSFPFLLPNPPTPQTTSIYPAIPLPMTYAPPLAPSSTL